MCSTPRMLRLLRLQLVLVCITFVPVTLAIQWDHSAHLDDAFRLLWSVRPGHITFEMQVRTHGYVGLGFARNAGSGGGGVDEERAGADVVVGWVDRGQTYFQDRHFKMTGAVEPRIDPSEDYTLLLGYENVTHTVLRFERKTDTCDTAHDVVITNDTMRLIYMYHPAEPRFGAIVPGSLPQPHLAYRGAVPLQLMQRMPPARRAQRSAAAAPSQPAIVTASATDDGDGDGIRRIALLNEDVPMPLYEETLQWCRVFELPDFRPKHHLVRYEPAFGSARSRQQLDQIVLYECQGNSVRLAAMARDRGRPCAQHVHRAALPCNAIVASWTRGSAGLSFPPEAGIPLDSARERFYLMESHYSNTEEPPAAEAEEALLLGHTAAGPLLDDSGLYIYVTKQVRRFDAGVLSIGMNPDWRHIIPPGHEHVISEGHCVDDCTRKTFPAAGIAIFAVVMQTHSIGKAVRLRQIRQHEELLPIAVDAGVHAAYAEYRHIVPAARVLPGDSMVVECTYDSTARDTITLGGTATRAESCNALAVYYPRQKRLTACHSLPSLPTVLHSLGIAEIDSSSQPVLISAPPALAGMSLEERLLGYDWARQFESFQRVTRAGSFQAVCTDARHKTVLGTDLQYHYAPIVTKIWRSPRRRTCPASGLDADDADIQSNDIDVTEIVRDRFDRNGIEYMGLSGARRWSIIDVKCGVLLIVGTMISMGLRRSF